MNFHLLQPPGKISNSDRFPLKPTGPKKKTLKTIKVKPSTCGLQLEAPAATSPRAPLAETAWAPAGPPSLPAPQASHRRRAGGGGDSGTRWLQRLLRRKWLTFLAGTKNRQFPGGYLATWLPIRCFGVGICNLASNPLFPGGYLPPGFRVGLGGCAASFQGCPCV